MSSPLDTPEAQDLIAACRATYPHIDLYIIESMVLAYLQGNLTEEAVGNDLEDKFGIKPPALQAEEISPLCNEAEEPAAEEHTAAA